MVQKPTKYQRTKESKQQLHGDLGDQWHKKYSSNIVSACT